jgi:hypothetical protein
MMILKQMILMVRMMRVWLRWSRVQNFLQQRRLWLFFSGGKDKEKTSESV